MPAKANIVCGKFARQKFASHDHATTCAAESFETAHKAGAHNAVMDLIAVMVADQNAECMQCSLVMLQ